MKAPAPARPATSALPEIEDMILHLMELRQSETSRERLADYQAVIDRLDVLAYRLKTAATPGRVVGLPKKPEPAPPAPAPAKPPQTALPLGPVIVRARKPRR